MANWSPPNYHNWYQVKVALEKKGFVQTPNFSQGFLHFIRTTDNKEIIYEKSNKMSVDLTKILLNKVDIDYQEFLGLYNQ